MAEITNRSRMPLEPAEMFVARQPIFDRSLQVFAYELLFRSSLENSFDGTEAKVATANVISSLCLPGMHTLLDGKSAFINFSGSLLLNRSALSLPPETTVIEVLETVVPGPEIVEACEDLHQKGYRIALDDFIDTRAAHPLAHIADFIKVDLRASNVAEQKKIISRYGQQVRLLAEKVETREEFRRALDMGYSYFQGYFFARPVVVSRRRTRRFKPNYLHILEELQHPKLDLPELTERITHEPALCYRLMRFANSALFTSPSSVESVERALATMEETGIRRWVTVVVLMDLAADKPSEILANALIRARFCELLSQHTGLSQRRSDLFLLGVLSRLDVMLGRPLEELLDALHLHCDIRGALLGNGPTEPRIAALWHAVLAYEEADWQRFEALAKEMELPVETAPMLYLEATSWADKICRGQK